MGARMLFCVVGVILLTAPMLTGCGSSKPVSTAINQKAFIGTWTEDTSGRMSRGGGTVTVAGTPANYRRMVFNEDGTFKMTVCDPSGRSLSPGQSVEGKWRVENDLVVLDVETNSLSGPQANWAPTRMIDYELKSKGAFTDVITIDGRDGLIRYLRAESDSAGG